MHGYQTTVEKISAAYARFVIKRRFLVIPLVLITALSFAYNAQYLAISAEYRTFFSEANPELEAFEELQARFVNSDNALIVITPPDGNVFTNNTLALVESLTEASWQTPYTIRVDSLTNFQYSHADNFDLVVEDLVSNAADLNANELNNIREIALTEPLLRNQLVTLNADSTAINLVIQYPRLSINEVPESMTYIREIVNQARSDYPNYEFAITGITPLNQAFAESAQNDISSLFPMMFATLAILLMIIFRSVPRAIVTMMVFVTSAMVAFGTGGLTGVELTPISLSTIVIVMTLAVADSVHILSSFKAEQERGAKKQDAIIHAVSSNFLGIGLTSLTTVIGFLTLNFSDSPPFQHLGNMTAAGVVAAWMFSVSYLPAVLSIIPYKVMNPKENKKPVLMEKIADYVIKRNKSLALIVGGLTLALVACMPLIVFDDQPMKYFGEEIEFRRDTDYSTQYFGLYPVEFGIPAAGTGGINSLEYLQTLEAFTEYLRQQDNVTHVYSITDIYKRINKNMNNDNEEFYRLPDSQELAAQYLLLYELSLPYGLDLNDRIDIEKGQTRVTVMLDDITMKQTQAFTADAENWLLENAPSYMSSTGTGAMVMFSYITDRNVASMLLGTLLLIVAIGIVMSIALKSVGYGLLSLVPNIFPIMATLGMWGILVGTVGISVSAVGAISFGIVIDDTVHFLLKYRYSLQHLNSSREQVHKHLH